jgi:CubicO group peptidase (beta-lactamase class C family)
MMMHFLAGYELTRKPGEKYDYSNLGFGLLGQVLGIIGKQEYGALVKERILGPLGMKDTMITVGDDKKGRLATPHGFGGQAVSYWQIPAMPGAGALYSTVTDMLTFLALNMGLKASENESLSKAVSTIQQPRLPLGSDGLNFIAWGWHLLNVNGQEYHFHDGGTGGFRSVVGFRRDKSWGIVVLVNSAVDCAELALSLAVAGS